MGPVLEMHTNEEETKEWEILLKDNLSITLLFKEYSFLFVCFLF